MNFSFWTKIFFGGALIFGLLGYFYYKLPTNINIPVSKTTMASPATRAPYPPQPLQSDTSQIATEQVLPDGNFVKHTSATSSTVVYTTSDPSHTIVDLVSFQPIYIPGFAEVLHMYVFSKDKSHAYFHGELANFDPNSLMYFPGNKTYLKDINGVYLSNEWKIYGADIKTFAPFPTQDSVFAKDANFVYFQGTSIKGANPRTFELVALPECSSPPGNGECSPLIAKDDRCIYSDRNEVHLIIGNVINSAGECINPASCSKSNLAGCGVNPSSPMATF